jgi:hypothetical protein
VQTEDLLEAILPLDVWDTHTHLQGETLGARSFWEIGHYFWYLSELLAAGYPADYRSLSDDARMEEARLEAYAEAYRATRNTAMHWVMRRIFLDLYQIEIDGPRSIRAADEAVRASAARPDWAREVCARGAIRRIVVNTAPDHPFAHLPGVSCLVPRVEEHAAGWIARLKAGAEAGDPDSVGEAVHEEAGALLAGFAASGSRGVMTSLEPFGDLHLLGRAAGAAGRERASPGADRASQAAFVLRALCGAAEREGLFLQLLSGIEAVPGAGRVQVNDPRRLLPLYRFFREYGCDFELVLGSSLDNLVAVQAATLFRNVNVGGMWWYNFRPSTYRQSMQYRLEGLPPSKSVLVVSDARSIEWCYGKVLLVKRLLAEVLAEQVQRGWLGREDALWVAREWLHEAPARRYG